MNKNSSIAMAHEYINFYYKLRPKHPILVGISAVQVFITELFQARVHTK